MAKTTPAKAKPTVPNGLKVIPTTNRKGDAMFLGFVDKAQGVYGERKGALARTFSEADTIARLNEIVASPGLMKEKGLVRVSSKGAIQPATKSAPATARAKGSQLESIED